MEAYSKSSKGLREMISNSRGDSRTDKSFGDRTNIPSKKLTYGKSKKNFGNLDNDPFGEIDTLTKKHTRAIKESYLPEIVNSSMDSSSLKA